MRRLRIMVPTLLAVLMAAGCAHGQRGARTEPVTISGTVRSSTGLALPGAMLIVSGTRIGTITNDSGTYVLHVPADSVEDPLPLTVQLLGFETIDERVAIVRSDSLTRDFVLKEISIRLDGLAFSATSSPHRFLRARRQAPRRLTTRRTRSSPGGSFARLWPGCRMRTCSYRPVSTASALAMAFEGARGSTAEGIRGGARSRS